MSIVGWFLLLVVLAVAGAVAARRLRGLPARPDAPPLRPTDPTDDLASLGLSEARPAGARPVSERAAPPALRPTPTSHRSSVLMPPAKDAEPLDIEPRPGGVRLGHDAPWNGRAVPLLLGSLSAHSRGHVAVVRRDGGEYAVVARTDGGPLAPVRADDLDLDGPRDLGAQALGPLASMVGGPARAVPVGPLVVLVGGDGSDGPAADRYLDLLADLTPGASASLLKPDPGAPDRPAPEPADTGRQPGEAHVPRSVLIANEQEDAHAEGRPLAFALVTLADAEGRLTQDTPQAVAVAESALRRRLEETEGVRRVEPFGDLLFGAFIDRDPEGTAAWCDALAAGEPPLFIGAVAPADGEPADIRDAAAEALRDAYDRRGTRVVVA